MTAAIVVDSLVKEYRAGWRGKCVRALDGISFEVRTGEAFGFIGPNGAGKSTTIKLLIGAMLADAGTIQLQGRLVADPDSRRQLGYVPENPSLHEHLTPLETLRMAMKLHRIPASDQDALTWLGRLDLSAAANRSIRSFSKGMVQRTAIAAALAVRPRLLILDEPLSGLDPIGRRDVVDLLAEYKRNGGTLFFTSHVLHDVERLADRFGLVLQGRLTEVNSPAELVGGDDTVLIRSLGTQAVEGMTEEAPGRWSTLVARGDIWKQLDVLRSSGHSVLEVRPTLSLESAFLRAVGHK